MVAIDWTAIIVGGIAFCGSAGLWTLIDHRQQRRAEKEMHESEILKEIKSIHAEIDELREAIQESEAKTHRVRILRFADEIFMNIEHSKDSFDQVLSDITDYDNYCETHPGFVNNQTVETANYIKQVYKNRMDKKDFARYGSLEQEGKSESSID